MWTATAVKPVSNHARECLGVPLPALLDLQFARQNTLDVIVKTVIFFFFSSCNFAHARTV